MASDPIVPATTGALSIPSTPDERQSAMLSHILGGFISWIGPLIFLLTKKDSAFVQDQAKESLNFQILMFIIHLVGSIVTCGFGIVVSVPVAIVFGILGGLSAQKGTVYRYPFNLRLIK